MGKIRNILFVLGIFALLTCIQPAVEATSYTGACGYEIDWVLDIETGVITFEGTGDMWDLKPGVEFAPWTPYISHIKTVKIQDGITSIGDAAFYNCINIINLEIPNSVTSIGDSAFYNCSSLTDVVIPNNMIRIGDGAFINCTSLTNLVIPENVTSIGRYAFYGCSALSTVKIPDSVSRLGDYSFYKCWNLTHVEVGNNVNHIGAFTFFNCIRLMSVSIGDKVTSIGDHAFSDCPRLFEIILPDNMTSISSSAFFNCANLTNIVIPEDILHIGKSAFEYCTNLRHVLYKGTEDQWDSIRIDEGNHPLYRAIHYEATGDEVYFSDTCCGKTASCVLCKNIFAYIPILEKEHTFVGDYCSVCDVSLYFEYSIDRNSGNVSITGCSSKNSEIEIPDTIETLPVTEISERAFQNNQHLVNIEIGNNVQIIGADAFAGCRNLANVSFRDDLMNIERGAFYECPALNHMLYTDSPAAWNSIQIDIDNLSLYNAVKHYYANKNVVYRRTENGKDHLYCIFCNANLAQFTDFEGSPFLDIDKQDYFYIPILWAAQKGITNGTSTTEFSPGDPCTRGQIVTFLWRTFGSPEPTIEDNPFVDVLPNMYYYKAVLWAVEQGITTGTTPTKFEPDVSCTRGQVVTFLWRACGNPSVKDDGRKFSDVDRNMYYYQPVIWAVEEGITNGTGNNNFSPEECCTRGQIVTFLYRTFAQ